MGHTRAQETALAESRATQEEVMVVPRRTGVASREGLEAYAAGPTADQQRLIKLLRVAVEPGLPRPVVAALLRRHLRAPLDLQGTLEVTEGGMDYPRSLCEQTGTVVIGEADDRDILDAWVSVMHAKRTRDHLARLEPSAGDIVACTRAGETRLGEVSSISADGRLNFRGGQGAGGRPHNSKMIARRGGGDNHAGVD